MKVTILASFVFAILLAVELNSCGSGGTNDTTAAPTPVNEVDAMINEYEKVSNECLRLSKKHTTGDVSITVLLIQARKNFQDKSANLQQSAVKLSPSQAQRVAAISAKGAPCLQP